MVGAIEFLRKAKAICNSVSGCSECPAIEFCVGYIPDNVDETKLVRKVMDYQIKEDADASN